MVAHPNPEELRAQAAQIEASAAGVSDSSEYPRLAKSVCHWQANALREYAETVETYGGEIPPKRAGMTGEERRERRATILRLRAARLKVKAADGHRASHDIGSRIPFGQPILVGHHSERGHRRAIDRMHSATSKAIAADNYANNLESCAESVERSHAINKSDSDAIEQYREKLARLTKERDNMKAVNAAWRRYERSQDPIELRGLGFSDNEIARMTGNIASAYSWEKQPHPRWQISNLGAVIRDTEKKLAGAEARATQPERKIANDETGIRLEDSPVDNRVRLFFPGKPTAEIRTQLKRNGFRWAPSIGCWQAFRNYHSQQHAAAVIGKELTNHA